MLLHCGLPQCFASSMTVTLAVLSADLQHGRSHIQNKPGVVQAHAHNKAREWAGTQAESFVTVPSTDHQTPVLQIKLWRLGPQPRVGIEKNTPPSRRSGTPSPPLPHVWFGHHEALHFTNH